jgi:predicted dehydrogenase
VSQANRAFSVHAKPKPYRVGVIGHTGRGNYGHGLDRCWREVPNTTVVAVADPHEAGRKAAQERAGAPRGYADYRKMLEAEKPDLVSIAPRHLDQHHDMLLAAVAAGAKGIYCEKPLCPTLAEADAMVAACETKGVQCAVAHQTRYSPRLRVVRELLEAGRIGRVIEFRGRGKEDRRGGGEDLWVLGTHVLDLIHTLGGEPQWCSASVYQEGRPIRKADVHPGAEGIGPLAGDEVHAMYRLDSGSTAYFDSVRNTGGRPTRFGLFIFGAKGVIELHTGYLPNAHLLEHSSWSPGRTGAKWQPITSAGVGKPEPLKGHPLHEGNVLACKDLIECIQADREPVSSIQQARTATEMIVGVFESQRRGRPVAFPLETRRNPLTLLG